jgi:hypothetical protein
MNRQELLLVVLAGAGGQPLTPVQIQKAMFLVTRNLPNLVTDGPSFNFVPYDYGPFDAAVYNEADALKNIGFAHITPSGRGLWKIYSVSAEGQARAHELSLQLSQEIKEYIRDVAVWVRGQSFSSLVKSIYEAYPEMRANSIFNG